MSSRKLASRRTISFLTEVARNLCSKLTNRSHFLSWSNIFFGFNQEKFQLADLQISKDILIIVIIFYFDGISMFMKNTFVYQLPQAIKVLAFTVTAAKNDNQSIFQSFCRNDSINRTLMFYGEKCIHLNRRTFWFYCMFHVLKCQLRNSK